MRLPGFKAGRQTVRWLRSRLGRRTLILGYHRVADAPRDPYGMCVRPCHFAEQMAVLRQVANPITLSELRQALRTGALPNRAVAVTFDDGYVDLLPRVRPLLEKYAVPAAVFVTTGYLGREFWWDELERLIMAPPVLPQQLSLALNGQTFNWSVMNPVDLSFKVGAPSPRQRLLSQLYAELSGLPEERPGILAQIRSWVEAEIPVEDKPAARAISAQELVSLVDGDLVEVGSHTVTHPRLTSMSLEAQRYEIRQSKRTLEEIVGRPVVTFSYPHGGTTPDVQRLVKESGFSLACASQNDVVRSGSNPLCLPRFWIPDWDGVTFSRWLQKWLAH